MKAVVGDHDLAEKLWRAVLSITGTNPVGWTRAGEIDRVIAAQPDACGQFWPRRDMNEVHKMLSDAEFEQDIPDDVPLYAAPILAMTIQSKPPRVVALRWSVGGEGLTETHYVDTIIGRYAVWTKSMEAHVIVPGSHRSLIVGSSIEDAQQFAQNHFSAQILGQLTF